MLYKIKFNPMHPLYCALPRPYVSVICYTRCSGRASVYLLDSSLRNLSVPQNLSDLADPVFDGVGLAGFKSRANAFLLA